MRHIYKTKNIGTERKPHTSLFDPGCRKTPQIDTSVVYDAMRAGRSAVDISAETFLKMTLDRADVNVHTAWQMVGRKLLANVILFCVWELSASRF